MVDLDDLLRPEVVARGYTRTAAGACNTLPDTDHPASGAQPQHIAHYQQDALAFDYFDAPVDPAVAHESERLHQVILGELPAGARTVLDVGCGKAWVARTLAGGDRTVVSFDVAPRNVEEALRRYPGERHFGVIGDVLALPFRADSVDAVISSEVMEHVPDVGTYLANLIRVVRPGGRIIITTPYDEKIQYSLCIHCNRRTPLHAHLHSFNEAVVARLLRPFTNVEYRTATFSNKALLYLRTHALLGKLPFRAWRVVDTLAGRAVNKPARLLLVIDKQ